MKASTAKKIADKKNSKVTIFKTTADIISHIKEESKSGFCNTFGVIHYSHEKKYLEFLEKKGYKVFVNRSINTFFLEIEIEWFLQVDSIKKNMILIYKHSSMDLAFEVKVVCKERWGNETLAKCRVINNKAWYSEVFITLNDIQSGRIQIKK